MFKMLVGSDTWAGESCGQCLSGLGPMTVQRKGQVRLEGSGNAAWVSREECSQTQVGTGEQEESALVFAPGMLPPTYRTCCSMRFFPPGDVMVLTSHLFLRE